MAEKILVVDDEEDIRLMLSEYLTAEGFAVLTAENGVEGIRLFREAFPDLVIVDIKMPVRNGIDLLNDIKEVSDDVEVIILTGHSDEATAIQCLRQGAYDYLLKPIADLEDPTFPRGFSGSGHCLSAQTHCGPGGPVCLGSTGVAEASAGGQEQPVAQGA